MHQRTLGMIFVGAGSSRRMGGIDKVWSELGNRPIVWYSLQRLASHARANVLVVRADRLRDAARLASEFPSLVVVEGGEERQDSVARGLAALPPMDLIGIHDVARPLVPEHLLMTACGSVPDGGGAVPGVGLTDTIKRVDAMEMATDTLDRQQLRAIQTPQVFHAAVLREVHGLAIGNSMATDDATLVERAGHPVRVFPGAACNFKITTAFDLSLAEAFLTSEQA